MHNRAQRQTTSVLQDNSTTCSISWWQRFKYPSHWQRGQRCGKCEPFGSRAAAEFENNDSHCDTVKRLQRKETWTKKIWEKSPAGMGAHVVRHLIQMFGGDKENHTSAEDKDVVSGEETGQEIKRLRTILKRNRVCQSRWWLVKKIRLLLLFPTVSMELCKQTKTHTSAASAHSSQTSQPRVSNTHSCF